MDIRNIISQTPSLIGTGLNIILATPQNDGITPIRGTDPDSLAPIVPTGDNADAFIFQFEGENTATLESEITDHYSEDNQSLQTNIALKPIIITTQGFIGELSDFIEPGLFKTIDGVLSKLGVIGAYAPAVSTAARLVQTRARTVYQAANTIKNIKWKTFPFQLQNKQQNAFGRFQSFYVQRTLFTVQTPWQVFDNMAIQTLKAVQDAETNSFSTFEITFKQLRFATTKITKSGQDLFNDQVSQTVGKGTNTPRASTKTVEEMTTQQSNSVIIP